MGALEDRTARLSTAKRLGVWTHVDAPDTRSWFLLVPVTSQVFLCGGWLDRTATASCYTLDT